MSRLLLVVEEAFTISGRGTVVVPALDPQRLSSDQNYDATVRLMRPDGTECNAIAGICWSHLNATPPARSRWERICLLKDVTKEDVPPGTEVWLLDES